MELNEEMSCRFTPSSIEYGQKGVIKNTSKSINVDKRSKLHSWCSHDYLRDFLFRFLSVNIPQLWSFCNCGGSRWWMKREREISFSYWLNFIYEIKIARSIKHSVTFFIEIDHQNFQSLPNVQFILF